LITAGSSFACLDTHSIATAQIYTAVFSVIVTVVGTIGVGGTIAFGAISNIAAPFHAVVVTALLVRCTLIPEFDTAAFDTGQGIVFVKNESGIAIASGSIVCDNFAVSVTGFFAGSMVGTQFVKAGAGGTV
jgi:hypothetical protein